MEYFGEELVQRALEVRFSLSELVGRNIECPTLVKEAGPMVVDDWC